MINKIFEFSWCVCSFDQRCRIEASTKEKAKEIFAKKVIQQGKQEYSPLLFEEVEEARKINAKTWAANFATVSNLSKIYTKTYLKNFKVDYRETNEEALQI